MWIEKLKLKTSSCLGSIPLGVGGARGRGGGGWPAYLGGAWEELGEEGRRGRGGGAKVGDGGAEVGGGDAKVGDGGAEVGGGGAEVGGGGDGKP